MKETITFSRFALSFKALRPDNFTLDGLRALYDYLTQLEEDSDHEHEFDVIGFCCEFSEVEPDEHYEMYINRSQANDLIVAAFRYDGVEKLIVREG